MSREKPVLLTPAGVSLFVRNAETRVPFRFGAVTLLRAPVLMVEVVVDVNGRSATGYAADLLVPRWFRKDIDRAVEDDWRMLCRSASAAGEALLAGRAPATVFDHWWRVWRTEVERVPFEAGDRLERGFGVALIERALIDAVCRALGKSFYDVVRDDQLGFTPSVAVPGLAGWDLVAGLPSRPLQQIQIRHTVGMLDPLRERDKQTHVGDGFPETLDAEIRERGISHFKIKTRGEVDADCARLLDVWRVVEANCRQIPRVSLDGNEQFANHDVLATLLRRLAADSEGKRLLAAVTHIEQPIARSGTFRADPAIDAVREFAPLILDEADVGIDAFSRAFELGYRGISVKNCKGVFRAFLARGLVETLGDGAFQTGEDLTNLPVLSLQQDLATMALCGIDSVERNGHHYFPGMTHLPNAEAADALQAHSDLYRPWRDSAAVKIEHGRIDVASLDCPGYACDVSIRLSDRTPLGEWLSGATT